jgi:hypothetical protein
MIVEIDKENIKSITIWSDRGLFENEIYVPDNWGTKEILDNLCCSSYNSNMFSIKNINNGFFLFDVDDNYDDKEPEIFLVEI